MHETLKYHVLKNKLKYSCLTKICLTNDNSVPY